MQQFNLQQVHAEISRMARGLHGHELSSDDLLHEVTDSAVRLLPGVEHSSVTLVEGRRRKVRSTAGTGPIPQKLDELQEKYQQGPCLTSMWDHHTVVIDDFEKDARGPKFTAAAIAATPVRSSLSIQLFTDDTNLGALNLFAERAHGFNADAEEIGLALAAHAAVALSGAVRSEQFKSALASRDIIGQAKGILMERYNIDAVTAFNLLIRLSQERNVPLAQIADLLVRKDHPPT
jgi:GAF domain-containing protein